MQSFPELPDKPSIAVLPFDNMSAESGQDYLADGIVEAITAALSRIRSFFVIARSSAFTYKGRTVNVRDIGKELGVAYLIEGSVQKGGNRLRITVQLVETETGAHVWSSRYDGTVDDIFDLQDRITEQLAGAIQPSIRIAEIERSQRKRPQDLGSYDYTMRAMPHVWALEKDESTKALELLEKALAIDPEYPLALSLAGWCHAQRSVYNFVEDIAGSQAKARALAERAAELSGDDPIILAVLGAIHTFVRNYGTARILLERALTLDPNSAWAWTRLGWVENYSDRPRDAITHFERALRLSPLDPMNFNNYVGFGSAHELLGEYDKAAAMYRRALEERPNARWIYRHLAGALSGAGRVEEGKAALAEMLRSYPDLTISKFKSRHGLFRRRGSSAWRRTCAGLGYRNNVRLNALGQALFAHQRGEARDRGLELQLDRAGRAMALLADDDFGLAVHLVPLGLPFGEFLAAARPRLAHQVVIFLAEDEQHHVGVLLDRARFTQVRELRALVVAAFDLARELRQRHDRHVQFLRQRLELGGDLGHLLHAAFRACAWSSPAAAGCNRSTSRSSPRWRLSRRARAASCAIDRPPVSST